MSVAYEDLSVRKIASTDVVVCEKNQSLAELIQIMNLNRLRRLPVLEGSKVQGILTIMDILKAIRINGIQKVTTLSASDVMSHSVIHVSPLTPVLEAAAILQDKHVGSLLLYKDEDPVIAGIVTISDYIYKLGDPLKENNEPIDTIMTREVKTLTNGNSLNEAIDLMLFNEIHRVPVVNEDNEVVGIVTAGDILEHVVNHLSTNDPEIFDKDVVGFISTKKVITVYQSDTIADVFWLMNEKHIGAFPVLDQTAELTPLVGIVTDGDLFEKLMEEFHS